MNEQEQIQRPKTALQTRSRSRNIRPLLRQTCWAPPGHLRQHQTGEAASQGPLRQHQTGEAASQGPLRQHQTGESHPGSLRQHQTGEGLKPCSDLCRFLGPPHKGSLGVSRLTQTSPADAEPHTDTHQNGASEAKEDTTPWYLTLLKEKEQSVLKLGNEISRLSRFESECMKKESEIMALREKLQLRQTNENVVRAQAELILDLTEEVRRLRRADEELQQKNQHIADLQQEVTRMKEEPLLQKDLHVSGIQQEVTRLEEGPLLQKNQHIADLQQEVTHLTEGPLLQKDLHVSGLQQDDIQQHNPDLQQEVTCLREEPPEWEEPPTEAGTTFMEMETTQENLQTCRSGLLYSKGDELDDNKNNDKLSNAENKLIASLERTNQALMDELEEAKANQKMSSGTLCSMRRALSVKEHELLTVHAELEDLKKELKDRMTQLQAMSRKFSCLRDGKTRDELMMTLEKDNYSLRQLVMKLQAGSSHRDQGVMKMSQQVRELEEEARVDRLLKSRLRSEAKEREEAMKELQHHINSTQVTLEQLQSKYERLRMKVIQAVYSAPGAQPPQKEINDTAIYYTMQKIIDDRSKFHQRLVQKGEKVPSLAINDAPNCSATPAGKRGL